MVILRDDWDAFIYDGCRKQSILDLGTVAFANLLEYADANKLEGALFASFCVFLNKCPVVIQHTDTLSFATTCCLIHFDSKHTSCSAGANHNRLPTFASVPHQSDNWSCAHRIILTFNFLMKDCFSCLLASSYVCAYTLCSRCALMCSHYLCACVIAIILLPGWSRHKGSQQAYPISSDGSL